MASEKNLNRYSAAHAVYNLHYHIVFCPKYRRPVLETLESEKGYTSHVLRERHDWLRSRLSTLWTRSYYIGSAGVVSQETIMEYIENQKNV